MKEMKVKVKGLINLSASQIDFKKAVYELARFNSTLTKGYRNEWKSTDYDGYTKKNNELKRLVEIAKKENYPVFYDGRTKVVYFIFNKVQISFHVGSNLFHSDNLGLPNTKIEWDGVKNAYKYTKKKYLELKEKRKRELQKRIAFKNKKEDELIIFARNYIRELEQKLKRVRTEKSINDIVDEINKISEKSTYGLYEYFRYWSNAKDICRELSPMYFDSYIVTYSV